MFTFIEAIADACREFIVGFFKPRNLVSSAISIGFILPFIGESVWIGMPMAIVAGLIGAMASYAIFHPRETMRFVARALSN